MRVSLFLILISALQVIAGVSYSQSARLSLNMKNSTIREVLSTIEDKSDFYFLYNNQLIDVERKVNFEVTNEKIDFILSKLFDDGSVNVLIRDRHIILTPSEGASVIQQQKTVAGKVTDNTGVALPGVSVILKGTQTGTVTNNDGSFSLSNIPENSILQFSFIGMKTLDLNVGNKTSLTIVLETETFGVDEVIVTALGIKRQERALGYSVQAVNGETVQTVKGIDVSTSLSGQIAGLRVKNSTEFTDEATLVLRGETPLLVVDGVPYANMRLRDIPADDIESLDVLKGATASALYGALGGSGAIMITTKRGMKSQGVLISVNSSTMFNAGFVALPEVQSKYGRNFSTRSDGKFEIQRNAVYSFGQPFEGQMVYQWDPYSKTMVESPYLAVGKDNFKNFLEQGYVLNNNVNITQQSEVGSFRTSASWVENKGIYPNSMFDKITFSAGGEMKFKKLLISSNLSYNKQNTPNKGFGGYTAYDPMYSLLIRGTIDYDIRDYRDYWVIPNEVQNNSYTADVQNAYFDRYERTFGFNRDIFNGNLALNFDLAPGLKAIARIGYDTYSVRSVIKVSKGNFQSAGSGRIAGVEIWGESLKGSYNAGIERGYSYTTDGILMFDKEIKDFRIEALAGVSSSYKQDESILSRTQGGLSIPGFFSLKASTTAAVTEETFYRKQTNSVYGKAGASWKNMAFIEGTIRNDWVSTLPESTRSYVYPSISGSFVASELLKNVDWLSLWKIRGSWTSVKTPANVYEINNVISVTNPAWGTLPSATSPSTIRPTDLFPQSATTLELGTNVNVFKNLVSFDFTYYQKKAFDYIKSASVSPISGYGSIFLNTDEERTRKGFEVTVKTTPVRTNDFRWDVLMNYTRDAIYYTKVDPLYTANVNRDWVGVGKRADAFISQDFLYQPGTDKIIHLNGLPQYSSYTKLFGYADPDWMWGLGTTLTYKNFKLNVNADGRVGGLITSYTEMYLWNTGNHILSQDDPNRYIEATQGGNHTIGQGVKVTGGAVTYDAVGNIVTDTRTFAENDVATNYRNYIQQVHKSIAWGGNPSPAEILDGTFFKIREISLTYDLPMAIISKVKMKAASVSVIAQNVFMWAKDFKYSDPDGGSENFADPSQRYVGFNLKFDF